MRALGLLAIVMAVPAAADPIPADAKATDPWALALPDIVGEAVVVPSHLERDGVLGMFGAWATGLIIRPGPFADARPFGRGGMVITPPDPNDPMALEMGTNQLQPRTPRTTWLPRDLSRGFGAGAARLWDLVLPHTL